MKEIIKEITEKEVLRARKERAEREFNAYLASAEIDRILKAHSKVLNAS